MCIGGTATPVALFGKFVPFGPFSNVSAVSACTTMAVVAVPLAAPIMPFVVPLKTKIVSFVPSTRAPSVIEPPSVRWLEPRQGGEPAPQDPPMVPELPVSRTYHRFPEASPTNRFPDPDSYTGLASCGAAAVLTLSGQGLAASFAVPANTGLNLCRFPELSPAYSA